jgi:CheY-like chemotaxis protein
VGHSKDFQGPIHLLLTDIMTPRMSGPEPAGEVSSLRPGIKVIFTSGYANDAIARQGVLDPAVAVIQNPIVLKRACAYSHRLGL